MSNIPSMKKQEVRFRGPSNSTQYNEFQDDAFYDVTQLFNLVNDLEQELDRTTQALDLTNKYQLLRIKQLEQDLLRSERSLQEAREKTGQYKAYAFSENIQVDNTAETGEQAFVDEYHGLVHLPITGKLISKVYIYDEVAEKVVTPSSLFVDVLPTNKDRKRWKIIDNNVLNAFNGDNTSYWHRKIIMPIEEIPKVPVQTEIIITLPENIISNKDVNMIYLHPFPANGVTIDKIEYRVDDKWKLLPGWRVDKATNKPEPHKDAGNIKFCFPTMEINQIKVTMTQPRYIEENYQRVYHFGIQELGIFHANYQSEVGKMNIPMHLPSASTSKLITGIKPKFKNELALTDQSESKSNIFHYNIYTIDENGQKHYTKDTFPIMVNSKDILVKATIYSDPNNKATPALESIELTYQDA